MGAWSAEQAERVLGLSSAVHSPASTAQPSDGRRIPQLQPALSSAPYPVTAGARRAVSG